MSTAIHERNTTESTSTEDVTLSTPSGLVLSWRPERGAKIVSVRDDSGREWLSATGPEAVERGRAFGDAEMAGWDECVPTITACTVDGHELPDHGDAWDAPWRVEGDADVIGGASWPYELRRTARVSPTGGVRLEYEATRADAGRIADPRPLVDEAPESVPMLWVAHPQFDAPPGTRVRLDAAVERVVDVLDEHRPELAWGEGSDSIDAIAPGACRKVALRPGEVSRSAFLERADGGRLRLTWSPECRFLSVWFDRSCYAPTDVVAIEPAIGRGDSLLEAIGNGTAPQLAPGRVLRWWLDIDAV